MIAQLPDAGVPAAAGDDGVIPLAKEAAFGGLSSRRFMGTRPSTKISMSSTKKPNFCTEMIRAPYSSPRCCSMNFAVFHCINSRSAMSARRSASDDSTGRCDGELRRCEYKDGLG